MKNGLIISENGNYKWYQNGHLHRLDGPAVEYVSGLKEWYNNGHLHRLDGPAVIDPIHRNYVWWINGYNVTDKVNAWIIEQNITNEYPNWSDREKTQLINWIPMIIPPLRNGIEIDKLDIKRCYRDGHFHNDSGPAIIYPNGAESWFINGLKHRDNLPAYISPTGHKEWWVDDALHRIDGPAIERADGTRQWHIFGNDITIKVEAWLTQGNLPYDYRSWTDDEKNWFMLRWIIGNGE